MASEKIRELLSAIIPLDIITKEIEPHIPSKSIRKTHFFYCGGAQNIGCSLTKTDNKEYITKFTYGLNREHFFYRNIYPIFQKKYGNHAKFISPFVAQIRIKETEIYAIIMENIIGNSIHSIEKLEDIFLLNRIYTSIKYKPFAKNYLFNELNHDFLLFHPTKTNDPITALQSFSSIHKKESNESLFKQIHKQIKKMKYKESKVYFERLEKIIMENRIFDKINPLENYSIQHGDFFEHNLIQKGKYVYCIDWGCGNFGPIPTDIAGFLGRMKLPYDSIQKMYLNNHISNHLSTIDRILFIYILIITWFIVYDRNQFEHIAPTQLKSSVETLENYVKLLK